MAKSNDIDASVLEEKPASEGTLSHRVYLSMKQAILTLKFFPGETIRKATICERLGVSRAPVAEAIARLNADGLVDIVAQSGTHVSYLSLDEIREASFLREAFELAAVDRIAGNLTEDQQKKLGRSMRLQQLLVEDQDLEGFYDCDEEFHALLLEFTGFPRLADVANTISLQITRARLVLLPSPGRLEDTLTEHRAVYDAVINGDKDGARAAMRHHLSQLMPQIEDLERSRPELFKPSV